MVYPITQGDHKKCQRRDELLLRRQTLYLSNSRCEPLERSIVPVITVVVLIFRHIVLINGRRAASLIYPYKSPISDVDNLIKAGKLNTKRSQYSAYLFEFLPSGTSPGSVIGAMSCYLFMSHVRIGLSYERLVWNSQLLHLSFSQFSRRLESCNFNFFDIIQRMFSC